MQAEKTRARSEANAPASEFGIEIRGLKKSFGSKRGEVKAIDDLELTIGRGEAVALLGPSGCGKTTILRCVAGLEQPDAGTISVAGRELVRLGSGSKKLDLIVPPEKRGIGMVFQSYALWPHMTVAENVSYPLRIRRQRGSTEAIAEQTRQSLDVVNCGHLADRYPGQLSGGQQQRIALARALIGGASTILFDEPLSNLDATLRDEMRFELARLRDELSFTALYVTHDQAEAMAFASRIAVMFDGVIQQIGTPEDVYHNPSSPRIARFLGSPVFVKGTLEGGAGTGSQTVVRTPVGVLTGRLIGPSPTGGEVLVCLRPECLEVARDWSGPGADAAGNTISGEVDGAVFLGDRTALTVRVARNDLIRAEVPMAHSGSALTWQRGDQVDLAIRHQDTLIYDGVEERA